jgi:hypothetical protein
MSKFVGEQRRNLSSVFGKSIGVFPKKKQSNPGSLLVEGILETEYCYHLEFDKDVIEYQSQPIGFHYYCESKRRFYTPDFLITYADGRQAYVEIKYSEDIDGNTDFERDFPLWQKQADELGIPLIKITDDFIRNEPFFSNIRHLLRASIYPKISSQFKLQALETIRINCGELYASELIELLDFSDIGIVYQLIAEELSLVNLHEEVLGPDVLLKWGGK